MPLIPKLRLPAKIRVPLEKLHDFRRAIRLRRMIKKKHFSIISVNCWGAEIYRDLRLPYQTPFVGLFLHAPCFIGFLEHYDEAIRSPLEFIKTSRYQEKVPYPLGLIMGKYEIHFVHYSSEKEAAEKWNRRVNRLAPNRDDCYFMFYEMPDSNGRSYLEELKKFQQLPFRHKVIFAARPIPEIPEAVIIPAQNNGSICDDGPVLYRRCHRTFDLAAWLNS